MFISRKHDATQGDLKRFLHLVYIDVCDILIAQDHDGLNV